MSPQWHAWKKKPKPRSSTANQHHAVVWVTKTVFVTSFMRKTPLHALMQCSRKLLPKLVMPQCTTICIATWRSPTAQPVSVRQRVSSPPLRLWLPHPSFALHECHRCCMLNTLGALWDLGPNGRKSGRLAAHQLSPAQRICCHIWSATLKNGVTGRNQNRKKCNAI